MQAALRAGGWFARTNFGISFLTSKSRVVSAAVLAPICSVVRAVAGVWRNARRACLVNWSARQ